jgi:hypothetical protein
MPTISVNFDSRLATVSASSVTFSGAQPQAWNMPGGSGPITIVPGSGGYFLVQGTGSVGSGGWNCSGSGCSGATQMSARAAGIFFGPVGDHAGVALGAQAYNSSGQTVANFGAVRVFCTSGC